MHGRVSLPLHCYTKCFFCHSTIYESCSCTTHEAILSDFFINLHNNTSEEELHGQQTFFPPVGGRLTPAIHLFLPTVTPRVPSPCHPGRLAGAGCAAGWPWVAAGAPSPRPPHPLPRRSSACRRNWTWTMCRLTGPRCEPSATHGWKHEYGQGTF